jgi:sarcosine oxidase gamma subunit
VIAGRVITADTGRPVKRARVIVTGGGRPFSATTDEGGRFRIGSLPAAAYNVVATKSGFVDAAFGQRRPQRAGTPVELTDGQQIGNIDIRLHRGGVITGRLVDEDGEPLAQAIVTVLRQRYVRGERQLTPAGVNQSDDRGQFRVFGLPPGEYYVSAAAGGIERVVRQVAGLAGGGMQEADESTGYAPTYYPGVVAAADAARLKLAAAQELSGIDFQIQLVPLATVKGIVSGGPATVMLLPEGSSGGVAGGGGRGGGRGMAAMLGNALGGALRGAQMLRTATAADGTFAIRNVTPGNYTIVARSTEGPGATAVQPLLVAGIEATVALSPAAPVTMSGTITLESGGTPVPKGFSGFRVAAAPVGPIAEIPRGARPADPNQNGEFTLRDVMPGQYIVRGNAPRGWMLKAVFLDGRDVTDQPVEVKSATLSGLNVIFSDRVNTIAGTVRDDRGAAAAGRTVIAFSTDEKLWYPQSRHIVTARTDASGAYRLAALPEGHYLIVAVEDVEQGEWFDPEYLEQVKADAQRITIGEGEQRRQDLKAAG